MSSAFRIASERRQRVSMRQILATVGGVVLLMALVACARAGTTGFAEVGPSGLGDLSGRIALDEETRAAGRSAGLAIAHLAPGARPELLLAERTIEREWGPSNDSLDARKRADGWKSEPFALAASAVLPGAGQAYVGETSALWFAAAEVAGWTARWMFHRNADRDREDAERIAGDPADSTSGWSYQRWVDGGSGRDAAQLQALWAADRAAYYSLIASDPQYLDGWGGADPHQTRASFEEQRDLSNRALARGRWSEVGLGLNHVIAAVDALRAARAHNLPVRRNLDLTLRGHWGRRGPSLVAVLERRF